MKQLLPLINATLLMLCALQINSSSAPFALQFNLQETVNNPVEKRWFISQSTEQRIIQSRFINHRVPYPERWIDYICLRCGYFIVSQDNSPFEHIVDYLDP